MPEHSSGRGRVDFALLGSARRPSVFIEVKGVGRSIEGDRQLFEYAFHEGVPLCVLTDGREWSFYLPSGQGTYDDRRVYRLQLDDREPSECERILIRYLEYQRVRSGDAFEDAQRDYRDLASKREAKDALPKAWSELVAEREELLLELIADKAEALSGFRPSLDDVALFLQNEGGQASVLQSNRGARRDSGEIANRNAPRAREIPSSSLNSSATALRYQPTPATRTVTYIVLGDTRTASNANAAFVDILKSLAAHNPGKLHELATAVQGRSRNHIARSVEEIYPARPDLARAAEIAPGWLVGLNIANREKMAITKTACDVFGLSFGTDVAIELPNVA
ncbi:MAG: hypothetical protein ABI673_06885 [Novosphingobium sp.]